jgi:A/G-specific adenine glycosylase
VTGRIEAIHVARARRSAMEPLEVALLAPGRGLPGDHHDKPGAKRPVTLVTREALDDVARTLGIDIAPGASRRNLTVSGLDLDALPAGTKLVLGTAVLEVRGPCDPCGRMETALGKGAEKLLARRGGVFGRVLSGGTVRPGDEVRVLSREQSVVRRPALALSGLLLPWFRARRRDLPWRRTKDPYAVWVSEVMLQQTQVATVIPYYEKFLGRFPTVFTLAEAPVDDVLAHWSGLGYYARARNLHKAAKAVVERHGGVLPRDVALLRDLPGFGPYTAGAVGSIALGLDEALVDGNVGRVLCRIEGWEVGAEEALVRAWARAPELIPPGEAGDFNQSLMELGATVCTPVSPKCGGCPAASVCVSVKRGDPGRFPLAKVRKPKKLLHLVALALSDTEGRVLLVRNDASRLFGGLWNLPLVEVGPKESSREAAMRLARGSTALTLVGAVAQTLTHREVQAEVFRVDGPLPSLEGRWVASGDLPTLGLSTLAAKMLAAAGVAVPAGVARRRKVAEGQGLLFDS